MFQLDPGIGLGLPDAQYLVVASSQDACPALSKNKTRRDVWPCAVAERDPRARGSQIAARGY